MPIENILIFKNSKKIYIRFIGKSNNISKLFYLIL